VRFHARFTNEIPPLVIQSKYKRFDEEAFIQAEQDETFVYSIKSFQIYRKGATGNRNYSLVRKQAFCEKIH
jgi:hypothetical protein